MDIDAMLVPYPPVQAADPQLIADAVRRSGRVLIVLDDDPTGTQSVADLPVLTTWGGDDFEWAFSTGAPAVYVLTNSRSFDSATAARINREIVTAAVEAARGRGIRVAFASRGDSTLRGHFPLEPDVIRDTLADLGEPRPDGVVLVPAFPDAGRVTVGGVHGLVADGVFTPVGDSEFARDSTFGFRSSRLADWVEEKSGGRIASSSVVELTLDVIRAGAERISDVLLTAPGGSVIAVDAVVEDDLRQLAFGLELAEAAGRSFVYRVGPPFVRARVGQAPHAPIEIGRTDAADSATRGGLIVVGSHVGLTSRQLAHLTENRSDALVVELDVPSILDAERSADVVEDAVRSVVDGLAVGDVILHSSRTLIRTDDPDESLAISRSVSDALVAVVSRTLAARPPRFVIAKGGITSSDVASRGLSIGRAVVRGSLFPGIVSVWQPADGPAAGIPYVVFAGNVGGDTTLTEAVEKLSIATGDSAAAAASHRKEADMTTPVVAVLGLGAMGLPMATRLAEDLTVRGFDIAPARLELAEAAGIVRCDSAPAAVDGADAVLLAVRDSAQLGDVLFGEAGIAAGLREGAVVILTSTVGTDGIADVASRLAEHGVELVDAPLSGGPARAGAGDLLIVVGATPEARAKAQPVLERLASTLTVVGDRPGDGQALKTVNQLLCGVHIAAAAEALALADALGLDPERTLDALGAGAAASFMLANRGPRALQAYDEEGAPVLSRLDIFVKDMGIVTKAARNARLATPVAAAAEQLYLLGEAQGLAAADDSAVIKVVAPQRRTA